MNFYCLGYGSFNGWIATLGQTPEQKLDEKTGKEDLTEQRQVGAYFRLGGHMKYGSPNQSVYISRLEAENVIMLIAFSITQLALSYPSMRLR
jgi:hypothetical protein